MKESQVVGNCCSLDSLFRPIGVLCYVHLSNIFRGPSQRYKSHNLKQQIQAPEKPTSALVKPVNVHLRPHVAQVVPWSDLRLCASKRLLKFGPKDTMLCVSSGSRVLKELRARRSSFFPRMPGHRVVLLCHMQKLDSKYYVTHQEQFL